MGFTPQQVNDMSMWQWFAALNGYIAAHTSKGGDKLTEAEAEDLFAWIEADSGGPRTLSTQTWWWDADGPAPAGVVTFTVDREGQQHGS